MSLRIATDHWVVVEHRENLHELDVDRVWVHRGRGLREHDLELSADLEILSRHRNRLWLSIRPGRRSIGVLHLWDLIEIGIVELIVQLKDLREDRVHPLVVDCAAGHLFKIVVHADVGLIEEHVDLRRRRAWVSLRLFSRPKLRRARELIRKREERRLLLERLAHVRLGELELLDVGHGVEPDDAAGLKSRLWTRRIEAKGALRGIQRLERRETIELECHL